MDEVVQLANEAGLAAIAIMEAEAAQREDDEQAAAIEQSEAVIAAGQLHVCFPASQKWPRQAAAIEQSRAVLAAVQLHACCSVAHLPMRVRITHVHHAHHGRGVTH